jgi:hypothetical protein
MGITEIFTILHTIDIQLLTIKQHMDAQWSHDFAVRALCFFFR